MQIVFANNLPVFVHCQIGRDRTGCAIGAYRIAKQGWTAEQAIQEMERYGFKTNNFPSLVTFLKQYETKVRAKKKMEQSVALVQ